jgi:hypothetical protein
MRIKPYYLAPLLVAGAAGAIFAAPTGIVAPAPPREAVTITGPTPHPGAGRPYCGDFCGRYTEYGDYRSAPGMSAPAWSRVLERRIAPVP